MSIQWFERPVYLTWVSWQVNFVSLHTLNPVTDVTLKRIEIELTRTWYAMLTSISNRYAVSWTCQRQLSNLIRVWQATHIEYRHDIRVNTAHHVMISVTALKAFNYLVNAQLNHFELDLLWERLWASCFRKSNSVWTLESKNNSKWVAHDCKIV